MEHICHNSTKGSSHQGSPRLGRRSHPHKNDGQRAISRDRRKTPTTSVACWSCRRRKTKCTGERPKCMTCISRSRECGYEYDEGVTKSIGLQQRVHELSAKVASRDFLFQQMRSRSDEDSALLLCLVRLGADIDKLVARLKFAPEELLSRDLVPDLDHLLAKGPLRD
ncbi:unnamed protein product [Zymoseptoria tritici ST99CH_1A5]|uniref:Zn(2)-C6 fungal-type domain-containing protein n=1 Tax=Zymoseptoria tritici ST99CH_1A5 TaxID=1276529 RepID=A0A1Y6LUI7_ZYMTR|nr:unnamed protein product [Zymoseptoria tritici ST99CH_1A5]